MNFYVYRGLDGEWKATNEENYHSYIQNKDAIFDFSNFESAEQVREYIYKYFSGVKFVFIIGV